MTENYTLSLHDALPILWSKKRKRKVYRECRERRPCFGELLQIDGSIHQWFTNDDTYYCLLNIVDRKSTRLNSSHLVISYAVFCLNKKKSKLAYAMLHIK